MEALAGGLGEEHSEEGPRKRPRLAAPDDAVEQAAAFCLAPAKEADEIVHLLYVRWFGAQGQTKLNKLELRQIDTLEALEELPKELVESHYPELERLPDYFTSPAYTRFTPQTECLALPGDVVRTELRLALLYKGWEYTVLKRDANHSGPEPEQALRMMTAEFQGSDPLMAALGLRISLIAYPLVALSKVFLEDLHERLLASPDTFRGTL